MATATGDSSNIDFDTITAMDGQIEVLLQCKPLPESEIRQLCERVSIYLPHLRLLTCHRDRSRATVTAASSNHSNHQVNDLIEELLLQLCTRRLLDNHLYSSSSHGTII